MAGKIEKIIASIMVFVMLGAFFVEIAPEREPLAISRGYRYQRGFERALDRYPTFAELMKPYLHYDSAIPGLTMMKFSEGTSLQMVPQGVCVAGDYMIISAYDNERLHNSVLFVLSNVDPSNRILQCAIVLPDQNHVGGVAYDGRYLWIAKSTSKRISGISYKNLKKMANSGAEVVSMQTYDKNYFVGVTASFMFYYDKQLWVGLHEEGASRYGVLKSFSTKAQKDGAKLKYQTKLKIPGNANGAAMVEKQGETFLLVNSSSGRMVDSILTMYQVDLEREKTLLYKSAVFPPMVEEVTLSRGYAYFIFESAATVYSSIRFFKCEYPVDRICATKISDLFEMEKVK